jgi:hypothetical protein
LAHRALLVNAAFETFLSIGATFGTEHHEELRGVAVALYSGMLSIVISYPSLMYMHSIRNFERRKV